MKLFDTKINQLVKINGIKYRYLGFEVRYMSTLGRVANAILEEVETGKVQYFIRNWDVEPYLEFTSIKNESTTKTLGKEDGDEMLLM